MVGLGVPGRSFSHLIILVVIGMAIPNGYVSSPLELQTAIENWMEMGSSNNFPFVKIPKSCK